VDLLHPELLYDIHMVYKVVAYVSLMLINENFLIDSWLIILWWPY